jgi:hypothetical protein
MPEATNAEVAQRKDALYAICKAEQPISVRGVYYRTLGIGLKFATKGQPWYATVSRTLTDMRRDNELPHAWIPEPGRITSKPNTWDSVGQPLAVIASGFRRTLWAESDAYVEIWSEANTMMGVLEPVTNELDVYLRPAQGLSSETLSYNASVDINAAWRKTFIYQVGDFDPYGMEAWQAVQNRLGELVDVPVHFRRIAATVKDRDRYIDLTHEVKRAKNDHAVAVARTRKHTDVYGDWVLEVDAIPTTELRARVRAAIMRHIRQADIDAALQLQAEDRKKLVRLAKRHTA